MAVMELWRRRDLEGTVKPEYIDGNFFTQDSVGNLVGVKCYKDGAEVALTGSVTGYCVLPSGETVSVAGTRSGNQASILVPQSALAYTGPLGITLKLIDGNTITTLMRIIVVVYRSKTDTVITPSSQIITDWANQISAALQEVEDASAAQDVKIADLKSAFDVSGISIAPSFTQGQYITQSGNAAISSNFSYSAPIALEKGQTITVVTRSAANNVSVISTYKSSLPYTPLVVADTNDQKAYSYTATDDTQVVVTVRSASFYSISLLNADVFYENISDIKTKADNLNSKVMQMESGFELSDKKAFDLFELPQAFTGNYRPVNVYTNGEQFIVDFQKENFMRSGGVTYYAAPIADGGVSTNDGLTPYTPKNLYSALNRATDGDTVILLQGFYTSTDTNALTSTQFDKSINVIGYGNVIFCVDGVLYKAQSSKNFDSSTGLWTCTRSAVGMVSSSDLKFKYKQKTSVSDCQAEANSWYFSSGTLYINSKFEPDAIIYSVKDGLSISPSASRKLYFENITFVGARWSVMLTNPSSGTLETCFYKCRFTMTYGSYSNVRAVSGHHLFVECEASYSSRDGFAYSPGSGDDLQFVEIGCYSMNNGLQKTDSQSTSNGSTAHNGAKGIRINGVYGNNWGGNVADVQPGTMSVNLGCVAFDSCGTDNYNEGFSAQQPGATMWLYNCKAYGNIRDISATTVSGETSTLYAIDCDFQTMRIGAGNIVITGGRIIQSGSDLNDYTEDGVYKVLRGAVAQAIENCPVTTMFVMEVYNMDTIYTKQIIYADNGIYSRRKTSDTVWGAWRHADLIL